MSYTDNNTITNPWSGKKIKSTNNSKSMNNRNILDLFYTNNERWRYTFQNYAFITRMKEMLNISKSANPELHNKLASVNFIGLQPNVLDLLRVILDKFKKDNPNDKKIECILPDNLNELIQSGLINMEFFEITDKILGITNPGDEDIVKQILLN